MPHERYYWLCYLYLFVFLVDALHHEPAMIPLGAQEGIQHPLAFSPAWQILGPFQIGTRGIAN